jgi:hypothetical protein
MYDKESKLKVMDKAFQHARDVFVKTGDTLHIEYYDRGTSDPDSWWFDVISKDNYEDHDGPDIECFDKGKLQHE